jgi:hypothetical protein
MEFPRKIQSVVAEMLTGRQSQSGGSTTLGRGKGLEQLKTEGFVYLLEQSTLSGTSQWPPRGARPTRTSR